MKHENVKIFVVAHKPYEMPKNDSVLLPIHVGRVGSCHKKEMADIIGDDTGWNISKKNSQYCEMTAHYWIWKNVKNIEYVGVCHYRRFFGADVTEGNIMEVMADADVMLVEPSWYIDSVYAYFAKFIGAENMTILWTVMKRVYPKYVETLEQVCGGVKFYPFNMLLCKKEVFDTYCEWMFSLLSECEKIVRLAPYTNANRALAYMAELLTGVYFIHRKMKIKEVPYYKVEDGLLVLVKRTPEENQILANYETMLQGDLAKKVNEDKMEKFENPAILLGLRNDGIL